MFKFLKRTPLGYIILILNTGYEIISNVKCQISKQSVLQFDLQNNYWYQNESKKVIPLYSKDVERLKASGFRLDTHSYIKRLGYDDVLKYSKRKIIKLLCQK